MKFLLLLMFFSGVVHGQWRLENDQIRVLWEPDAAGFPVLREIKDYTLGLSRRFSDALTFYCGSVVAGGKWQVKTGERYLEVKGSPGCYDGLSFHLRYELSERELVAQLQIVAERPVELPQGLAWSLDRDYYELTASNHLQKKESHRLGVQTTRMQLNQQHWLRSYEKSTLCLFIPNPFHSFVRVDSSGSAWLDLLLYQPASSPYSTEGSWSQLIPGDTLFRSMQLSIDRMPSRRVFLSEHPSGWDRTLTMYLDELPNRDGWLPFSNATNPQTPVYSRLLRLMEKFPRMRVGLLLLTNRDVDRQLSGFGDWIPNHYQILADTLEKGSGDASVHLLGIHSTDSLVLSQMLFAPAIKELRVALDHRRGNGKNQLQACLRTADSPRICQKIPGSGEWKRDTVVLSLPGMIRDAQVTLELQSTGAGDQWVDNVAWLDSIYGHSLKNGNFAEYQAAYLFDHPRRHWSDAKGREYVPDAPEEYREFLQSLEKGIGVNGWEDRMRLGCHGLKHTSSIDKPDPEHEFSLYDPEGDSLRLKRIWEQFYAAGLTEKSLRFWRPSGLRSTRSLIHPLVERGVVWLDPGWWQPDPVNGTFFIRRGGNTLWGRNPDWWMDRSNQNWELGPGGFWNALERGHLVHLGGHPEPMLDSEEDYQELEATFAGVEQKFPFLGYVHPDEYADHATALAQLTVETFYRHHMLMLQLHGEVPPGTTLVFSGYEEKEIRDLLANEPHYEIRKGNGVYYVWFTQKKKGYAARVNRYKHRPFYEINGKTSKKIQARKIYIQYDNDGAVLRDR